MPRSVLGILHAMCFALAGFRVSLGNLSTYSEEKVTEVQSLTKQCGGDNVVSSCVALEPSVLFSGPEGAPRSPCDSGRFPNFTAGIAFFIK